MANISYIQSFPNSFVGVDGKELIRLDNENKRLENELQKVYQLALECDIDLDLCKEPENFVVQKAVLPARKQTSKSLERDQVVVKTKVHSLNLRKFFTGWHPDCYIKIELVSSASKDATPIRQSQTVHNEDCNNMNYEWQIPIAVLESTASEKDSLLGDSFLRVTVLEDDPYYDDLVGSNQVNFGSLNSVGAKKVGINNNSVNMTVDFEVR